MLHELSIEPVRENATTIIYNLSTRIDTFTFEARKTITLNNLNDADLCTSSGGITADC